MYKIIHFSETLHFSKYFHKNFVKIITVVQFLFVNWIFCFPWKLSLFVNVFPAYPILSDPCVGVLDADPFTPAVLSQHAVPCSLVLSVLSLLSCSDCLFIFTVSDVLSRMPTPTCHVLVFWRFCLFCSALSQLSGWNVQADLYNVQADLHRLTCSTDLYRLTVRLSDLSCQVVPAGLSLSRLFCPSCHILANVSSRPCPGCSVRPTRSDWPVLAVLPWLSYRSCPDSVFMSQQSCPIIFWPSYHLFHVMAVLSIVVLSLLISPALLFLLSCSDCLILYVMSRLDWLRDREDRIDCEAKNGIGCEIRKASIVRPKARLIGRPETELTARLETGWLWDKRQDRLWGQRQDWLWAKKLNWLSGQIQEWLKTTIRLSVRPETGLIVGQRLDWLQGKRRIECEARDRICCEAIDRIDNESRDRMIDSEVRKRIDY